MAKRGDGDLALTLANFASALDAVLLAAAIVALVSVVPSWLLLGRLSGLPDEA